MPTNQNAYNSRVTDEALEKRYRDTFRSQGGAELVDDLYASGVIVPVVDFTQAATGQTLNTNLQTAWDFSTGHEQVSGATTRVCVNNAGFWRYDLNYVVSGAGLQMDLEIFDGTTAKPILVLSGTSVAINTFEEGNVVFLRSGDSLRVRQTGGVTNIQFRQIATVNGDLVNPTGFTSS